MVKVVIMDQERRVFDNQARQISLPGVDGEFAVLDLHAPMISVLKAGRILVDGRYLAISRGIAMVQRNELVVLVER